ncbi:MAG: hypothetical protein EOO47_00155 [Flavobacterium sp.]|nr:MAG: hypothetical protein EOO47_00155 [Flavobacterium sp.]
MFEDYPDQVLATYLKKKKDGALSRYLNNPTTANLKRECLSVYDKRYTPKDDDILSLFFNIDEITNDFRKNILDVSVGSFRALSNHLKGSQAKTHERNTELLAWLIDFKPRPSIRFYKLINNQKVDSKSRPNTPIILSLNLSIYQKGAKYIHFSPPPYAIYQFEKIKKKPKKALGKFNTMLQFCSTKKVRNITVATILITGAALAGIINEQPIPQCMYWTGERYQPIFCNQKVGNTPIIAIDTFKVTNLKRITRPDTLTKFSIGKVWHITIERDSVQFYTSGGNYPLNSGKELKLSSHYILNKYALSKYKTIK